MCSTSVPGMNLPIRVDNGFQIDCMEDILILPADVFNHLIEITAN